jgi:G patch domain-containing protein 1
VMPVDWLRFEMPEIPPDWRPRPARVWGTTRRWDETPDQKPKAKENIRGAPGKPLTFEEVSLVELTRRAY